MTRPSATELARRVSQLEAGRSSGPLSSAERAELARIEAAFDREFPGLRKSPEVLKTWPIEKVQDFIDYECGRVGSPADRFYELQRRARTPEKVERDHIEGERIVAMSDAALEKWLNAQIHGSKGPPSWNR